MKVLITGGSGLVGTQLTKLLIKNNYDVVWLGRKSGIQNGITCYKWDYKNEYIDLKAFDGVTHIVHLAGAGVFDARWSSSYKQEIINSRVLATELLIKASSAFTSIKTCICASAIGIYGNSFNTELLKEEAELGKDFLAEVTKKWEIATEGFDSKNIRKVNYRIGIVLAKEGGALQSIAKPIKYFIGSPLASGKQIISWIHIEDLCRMILKGLQDDTLTGIYNAVAPNPVSNGKFTEMIGKVIKRPLIMPHVPSFALKIILGSEKAASVIQGISVSSSKIETSGFDFKYPILEDALKDLLLN